MLCCYCLGRIRPDESLMVIEHFVPQSDPVRGRSLELDWNNLLGSCNGSAGAPRSRQHCDRRKGDRTVSISPLDPRVRSEVRYLANGEVTSDSKTIARDLNDTLNLNVSFLVRNRKAVLEAFCDAQERKKPGAWTAHAIDRWIEDLTSGAELLEYGEIVVQFLEKKRKQKERAG